MKKTMKRTKWWLPALILLTAFQLISMAQVVFNDDGSLSTECLIFFGAYLAVEWVYFIAMSIARKRADPALEMIAFFLTGIGLVTVAGANKDLVKTQFVADMLGIFCFVALLWLISNVDRAMFMRTPMAVAAIGLLVLTLILARNIKGAFNWLSIGGMSIQPSEFVKVAFVFVGAATLDKLQTTRSLTKYIIFCVVCVALLFLMRDLGAALIFFFTFIVLAFMRSGDFRTIVLLCVGAAMAAGETEGFVRAEIWGGGEAEKRPLRELDCGESGSTLRFFIPLALDGRGPVRLIGHGRLMQRPLTVYQNLFAPLGVVWRQEGDALTVEGELKSGRFELPGDVSSQFITGLLLALPRLEGDSEIVVTTPLESRAYVELTRRVQREFGVTSAWLDGGQTLLVRGGQEAVSPGTLHIEGDWSHAAFYLVAGAIGRGEIRLTGLDPQSAQGDRAVVEILRDMGADIRWEGSALVSRASRLHGLRVDCAQIPDLVPILAVAMAAAEGESRITGAARLRIKESDRLSAMATALTAAGADAAELPDGLAIRGGKTLHAAKIEGCNDHRIVMAMTIASALSDGEWTITDAEATAKSAPAFWQEFERLGGLAR